MPIKTKSIKFINGTQNNFERKIRSQVQTEDLQMSPKTVVQTCLDLQTKNTRGKTILAAHPSFVFRAAQNVLKERMEQNQNEQNMDENMEEEMNESVDQQMDWSPNDPTALPNATIPGLSSGSSSSSPSLDSLPSRRHSSSSDDDFGGESMEMFCYEHLRPEVQDQADPEPMDADDEPMDIDEQNDGEEALDANIDLVGQLDESSMEAEIDIINMIAQYE